MILLAEAGYPLSYGRELIKELGDTLASPAGWHTLPVSHGPNTNEEDGTAVGRFWIGQGLMCAQMTWTSREFVLANDQNDVGQQRFRAGELGRR